MRADDVIGVWQLASYVEREPDGSTSVGPLGPDPVGVLIYSEHGRMSVSMMRTGTAADATTFMGYAGTWRLDGDRVLHRVEVSAHAFQVGTELVRQARVDGDSLTLRGTSVIEGRPRHRELNWRRAPAAAHLSTEEKAAHP